VSRSRIATQRRYCVGEYRIANVVEGVRWCRRGRSRVGDEGPNRLCIVGDESTDCFIDNGVGRTGRK
jgi:hypothetical protein